MKVNMQNRGSIMIWTLLLGVSLATVFFFFSQRLNQGVATQRETIKYHNAHVLLNSYADYLENLDEGDLKTIRDGGGSVNFQGITGTITNEVSEITGKLDVGQSVSYEVSGGNAQIDWGLCAKNEAGRQIQITPVISPSDGYCAMTATYDGGAQSNGSTFSLTALDAPVSFRILPLSPAVLYSDKWQFNLTMPVTSKKNITVKRTFIP